MAPQVFLEAYRAEQNIEATQEDFRWARSVGVNSFPTVLLRDGRQLAPLTVGYRPLQELVAPLEQWLTGKDRMQP